MRKTLWFVLFVLLSPYDITSVLYESVAEISRGLVATHRADGKEAASQQLKDRLKS